MSTDELYPDFKTVMFGDIEMPLSVTYRPRDLAPITAAEVIAHTKPVGPQQPRPAVTAYEGADMDAYYFDNGYWRHCQTGAEWVTASLDEAQGRLDAALGYVPAPVDEARRAEFYGAVAKALGVDVLEAAE